MEQRWTDIFAALAVAGMALYMVFEIARRQRKLRAIFGVLSEEDVQLTLDLERMVRTGVLKPLAASAAA
ncbi:MAG TPA: hypothetical protein VED45_11835 [Steroidobacteraceae bacterium]|nr:hypothetical protein [Steroidobacteraceae bacterium]